MMAQYWHSFSVFNTNTITMTLLDISSTGFFSNSAGFFHALGEVAKLAAGSFMIVLFAFFSFIGVFIYSAYKGYQTMSLLEGARTLIHSVAYLIGVSISLVFALVAGMFFSLATAKLLFATVLIAFIVGFVVRETFLFLVLKRFGKYLMYFTALQQIKERIYTNGQQENQP